MLENHPTSKERALAALVHLGYAPVGCALIAAIILHRAAPALLVFCILWTVGAWMASTREPAQPFLRDHVDQARRYHRRGVTAAICAVAVIVYFSFFTWGMAAALGLLLGPIALIAWMLPTLAAANAAIHGQSYRYKAVELTKGRTHAVPILTQREARTARRDAILDRNALSPLKVAV